MANIAPEYMNADAQAMFPTAIDDDFWLSSLIWPWTHQDTYLSNDDGMGMLSITPSTLDSTQSGVFGLSANEVMDMLPANRHASGVDGEPDRITAPESIGPAMQAVREQRRFHPI